jgi:hypothetical protein
VTLRQAQGKPIHQAGQIGRRRGGHFARRLGGEPAAED